MVPVWVKLYLSVELKNENSPCSRDGKQGPKPSISMALEPCFIQDNFEKSIKNISFAILLRYLQS